MRIIYDYQIFSQQEYGGISRYFYELASRIAQSEGCNACISAFLYVNKYIKGDEKFEIIGTPVPRIPHMGKVQIAANHLLSRVFVPHYKPDIIHETYYAKHGIAPAKAKTILTVYDMTYERFCDCFPTKQKISRDKAYAVKRADHIICISENTKNDLVGLLNVDSSKVSVIHLGYTNNAAMDKTRMDTGSAEKPYILYVGQRTVYKNFSRLLEAYAKSPRLQQEFKLVCFGGDSFSTEEANKILGLKLSLENVVHVMGNDGLLKALYANASLFVFPSLYEGFGIPLLEAMSLSCPVVCSNTSSFPEVAGEAADYFDPWSVDEMICSIESVAFSTERRKQLIARGLERIKLFSWEKCAEETLGVYSSLL